MNELQDKTQGEQFQPMQARSETDYTIQIERLVESVATDFERRAKQVRTVGHMLPRKITAEQFDATHAMIVAMSKTR